MPFPIYSKLEQIDIEQGVEDIYYQDVNHSLDTNKNNPEVAITCSNKVNRNAIETMEMERKVTNVKEEDEV